MYSKKNSKDLDVPFYALPGRRKSSAEIIRAAKEEVLMMAARRPTTPYSRSSSVSETVVNDSRPASSISWVSYTSETSPQKRPLSSIRLKPLRSKSANHREPIEDLYLEPTVIKSSLNDRRFNSKIQLYDDGSYEGSSVISEPDISATSFMFDPLPKNEIEEEVTKEKVVTESIDLENVLIGVEHSSSDASATKLKKFEAEILKFIPTLERMMTSSKKRNESTILATIARLRELLEESKMMKQPFENRFKVLKILFRLLNSRFPTLSLQIAKLVLEMGVSDQNLSNVFKLLYKICHTEQSIVEFLSCNVFGPFIGALKETELDENLQAVKYGTSLICLLSTKDLLLDVLSLFDCHNVLLQQLIKLNNLEVSVRDEETSYIIIKIVTAIRYLSENEVVWKSVLSNGTVAEIMSTLTLCEQNVQIAITTTRLLSKFAECSEGCESILATPDASEVLARTLEQHRSQPFVLLQTTFIIGNILSHDKETASTFYMRPIVLQVMYAVLNNFALDQMEIAKATESSHKNNFNCAGDNAINQQDDSDLTMKVIRVLANMCLSDEVGLLLAEDGTAVRCMLKIINLYKMEDSEVFGPTTCALIGLNNITYFVQTHSEQISLYKEVVETILPLLGQSYPSTIRTESSNIVQNLTRLTQIRKFIFKNRLIPAFVSLLDREHDLAVCGYSIILNLLTDKLARAPFYKEQGITKLLHKLHLCLGRDWSTAALLCQILWNFSSAVDDEGIDDKTLTHLEIQHLIKVLQYSIGSSATLKSDNEYVRTSWEKKFCPIAKKLLDHLQSMA